MLRAIHRVVRPGGVMCFATIAVADGIGLDQIASAVATGPAHVDAGSAYPDLLAAAGFDRVEVTDVSDEFVATLAAWVREWDAISDEISGLVGTANFTERQASRRRMIEVAREGPLRRYLISAVRL